MATPNGLALDPQILAQLAAAGFRPPPPMQMAPLNLNPQMPNPGPQQQQQGGGDGLAGGLAGLGALMPSIAKAIGGLGGAPGNAGITPSMDAWGGAQNPFGIGPSGNDPLQAWGAAQSPLGIGSSGNMAAVGGPDFWSGLWGRINPFGGS